MLRAYKTVMTLIVVSLAAVCSSGIAEAMTNDAYVITDSVTGVGPNMAAAKANAYQNMDARIAEIEQFLPPNHFIVNVSVTNEGHVLPTVYEIEFEVLVFVDSGPAGDPPVIF